LVQRQLFGPCRAQFFCSRPPSNVLYKSFPLTFHDEVRFPVNPIQLFSRHKSIPSSLPRSQISLPDFSPDEEGLLFSELCLSYLSAPQPGLPPSLPSTNLRTLPPSLSILSPLFSKRRATFSPSIVTHLVLVRKGTGSSLFFLHLRNISLSYPRFLRAMFFTGPPF